jgi:methylated-DNA-[protein]-cysteine S-methyltransferase
MTDAGMIPIDTSGGRMALAWQGERVVRIYLPGDRIDLSRAGYTGTETPGWVSELALSLFRTWEGEEMYFPLDRFDLESCSPFQRKVLLAEHAIPRGWVSTYGRIARRLGRAGSSRAVGRALATNPFPLAIPCHRAVRSDGSLGGYRGGLDMKKRLLQKEGVGFTPDGRVAMNRVYY